MEILLIVLYSLLSVPSINSLFSFFSFPLFISLIYIILYISYCISIILKGGLKKLNREFRVRGKSGLQLRKIQERIAYRKSGNIQEDSQEYKVTKSGLQIKRVVQKYL